MRMIRGMRVAVVTAVLVGGAITAAPAHAAPIYPMLFATISATPGGGAPTYTIDAQAPGPWTCTTPTWSNGTYVLRCAPPAAPQGFDNTCVWNVVKVQTTGVGGNLYGQSNCESHPGATASTSSPGASVGTGNPNMQFTYAYCTAISGVTDPLVRPWTVRCSTNH